MSDKVSFKYTDRSMPFSDEAEKGVISCLLQNTQLVESAIISVPDKHFYHPANRLIYNEICDMKKAGLPIDLVSLSARFLDKSAMDQIGGPSMLAELYSFVPTTAHWAYYTEILEIKYDLRCIINTAAEIHNACFEHQESINDIRDLGRSAITKLGEIFDRQMDIKVGVAATVDQIIESLSKAQTGEYEAHDPTDWSSWNNALGGIPKCMLLLKGEKGAGKTKLSGSLSRQCLEKGKPVLFFSMEMDKSEIIKRMICEMSGERSELLFHPDRTKITQGEMRNIGNASAILYKADHMFDVDDSPVITMSYIEAKAKKFRETHGHIGLIVIDHINRIQKPTIGRNGNQEQQLAELSDRILKLSRVLGCGIIVLTHMNRQGVAKYAEVSENDAPIILKVMPYGIVIEKNRNGPTGKVLPIGGWDLDNFRMTEDAIKSIEFRKAYEEEKKKNSTGQFGKTRYASEDNQTDW